MQSSLRWERPNALSRMASARSKDGVCQVWSWLHVPATRFTLQQLKDVDGLFFQRIKERDLRIISQDGDFPDLSRIDIDNEQEEEEDAEDLVESGESDAGSDTMSSTEPAEEDEQDEDDGEDNVMQATAPVVTKAADEWEYPTSITKDDRILQFLGSRYEGGEIWLLGNINSSGRAPCFDQHRRFPTSDRLPLRVFPLVCKSTASRVDSAWSKAETRIRG